MPTPSGIADFFPAPLLHAVGQVGAKDLMKSQDLQQCIPGFRTVAVLGGPLVVRVHEALDASVAHTPHRYVLSVDFKFKEIDALHVGKLGWLGVTKSEATREATKLSQSIAVIHKALLAAEHQALNWDTATNRYTVKVQQEAFDKLTRKYRAEFV